MIISLRRHDVSKSRTLQFIYDTLTIHIIIKNLFEYVIIANSRKP